MKWLIPPVLCVGCLAGMVVLDRWLPLARPLAVLRWLGLALLVAGVLLIVTVGLLLLRYRTEIHTFGEPRRLVTGGPFRFSRNPIYLGFVVSLLGAWCYLGSVSPLLGVVAFFLAANYWYIPFEEERLLEAFGEAYRTYQRRVARWLGPGISRS
ncbi:methyltransferase family protein [Lewinella sp. IMCC34183]|uniref:methyltransferase family protein n=1 Tax=Lewinella sp. IMCC34183 TaxID=2248762 RepID=UPI000E24B5B7|nr:isoprenylcysteine carboxylmethyltransferase family protein [Lewinella sp. IMCC34183]